MVADIGETAQFLAIKQTALTNDARNRFLDYLYEDLADMNRLLRLSEGNYCPDKYRERSLSHQTTRGATRSSK